MATNFAATYITRLEDETRERLDTAARERSELDVLSVYLVIKAKIEAGLVDEAKAIVKAYREGK